MVQVRIVLLDAPPTSPAAERGSYAIAAAVASSSEHVRTPAAVDTNFPQRGAEPVRLVRPGWVTYAYDSWTDPKMLRTSGSSRS